MKARSARNLLKRSHRSQDLIKAPTKPAKKKAAKIRRVSLYRYGALSTAMVGQSYPVPQNLDLQEDYEVTVDFLGRMRKSLAYSWQKVFENPEELRKLAERNASGAEPYFERYWDFSKVQRMTPEVALLIAAEFDVASRDSGTLLNGALALEKWKPEVASLLNGVGFFEITKVDPPQSAVLSGEGWRILKFRAGSVADGDAVRELLADLGLRELLDDGSVFEAIAEAITNTKHHAYKDHEFPKPMQRDWWMTGFILPKRKRVSISVWDRGLTIPATLPRWGRYPLVERIFRRAFGTGQDMTARVFDGAAIRIAMAAGETSTALSNRGQGLPLIASIVDLCASGHLRIHSRCGSYERIKGQKPRALSRNSELGGTLITWDWQFHAE